MNRGQKVRFFKYREFHSILYPGQKSMEFLYLRTIRRALEINADLPLPSFFVILTLLTRGDKENKKSGWREPRKRSYGFQTRIEIP